MNLRRTTATLGAAALLASPMAMLTASPAAAADREFRYAGAKVDFDVEKDDGRFEVDVDLDDARRGSTWRIVLRHNGKVFHNRIHRADSDGEVEVDRNRPNRAGVDRFKLTIKKVNGPKARTAVIKRR